MYVPLWVFYILYRLSIVKNGLHPSKLWGLFWSISSAYFVEVIHQNNTTLLHGVFHLALENSAEGFYVYGTLQCLPSVLIRRLRNSWKGHELETQHSDFLPYVPSNPALQGGQLNNFIIYQTLEHSAVTSHLEKFTAWRKGHSSNMNPNISEGWGYRVIAFSFSQRNIFLKI